MHHLAQSWHSHMVQQELWFQALYHRKTSKPIPDLSWPWEPYRKTTQTQNSGGCRKILLGTAQFRQLFPPEAASTTTCVIVTGTDVSLQLFLVYIREDLKNIVVPAMLTYHFVFWLCHRNFHFFSTWIITGRARPKIHHLFLLFLEAVCYCLDGFCPFFPGKI